MFKNLHRRTRLSRLAQSSKGEWTRELIGELDLWMGRKPGSLNFHLTQILSVHGCFGTYLYRMGLAASAECTHCASGEVDTPWHTLFECDAWEEERRGADTIDPGDDVIDRLAPDTLVPEMLRSQSSWNQVSAFVSSIMRRKMEAEWSRQRTLEGEAEVAAAAAAADTSQQARP